MKVLVFAEQRDGKLKSSAYEALTVASKLAGSAADCAVVLIGNGVSGLATSLAGYGCDKVYAVEGDGFAQYNIMSYAAGLEAAAKAFGAKVVLGAATPMGRDMFPRVAARMNCGLLTDLTSVAASGSGVTGTKPMYSGKCIANVACEGSSVAFVTIRQNVNAANKSGQGSASVEKLAVSVPESKIKTKDIRKGKSSKPDLTEASLIISGGRAMANADNFKILNECADVIGATVGASRAAVDSGYAPHEMQVGQTGKTVNPNLYIACGISGSIQHMAGMRTSKVIVAINTDKDAPIFGIATYGIVADLFQAVPVMTQKFKELMK